MRTFFSLLLITAAPLVAMGQSSAFSVGLRGSLFATFQSGKPIGSAQKAAFGQAVFARYESQSGWAFELSGQRLLRDRPLRDYALLDCWGASGDLYVREVSSNYLPALGLTAQRRLFSIGRSAASNTPLLQNFTGPIISAVRSRFVHTRYPGFLTEGSSSVRTVSNYTLLAGISNTLVFHASRRIAASLECSYVVDAGTVSLLRKGPRYDQRLLAGLGFAYQF